ncbi:MAG TPA: aminotransferase class I/II-fold pyridoxal phosphate-dependent enzyme [Gemmatimonadota bacterium]|nr:aminotransferase class I/II-fold pyridoxal phosphate-dependent enzyme [Gemmatimonadota bacterium]
MRKLGYRVVDLLVDHWATLRDQPAGRRTGREELERLLREPPPEDGRDPEEVLRRVEIDVLGNMGRVHHPRFFAFVPGPGNWIGVLGDLLAAGTNVFAGTWFEASGPAVVELVTVDWLRTWCGLPARAGGLFVSGGSMANLTALAVARRIALEDRVSGAVAYCSDQTHSAVDRAFAVLGFEHVQVRRLRSDDDQRLSIPALQDAIAADRSAGRRPFCVVANAGTTNTGAVDPLADVADLCQAEGIWMHADAAYGGAALLCERGRRELEGLERSDSLALDPHKWLFQPFEIGCVLVRDRRWLPTTFHVLPDYLRDVETRHGEVNFADYGIQLTRGFRALKLWMSIQVFGVAEFRRAVERGIENAERAEKLLRRAGVWRIVTPARMGVVTFTWSPPGVPSAEAREATQGLVEAALEDGTTLISSTTLGGEPVLRICAINPRTTTADLETSVERLAELAGRAPRA